MSGKSSDRPRKQIFKEFLGILSCQVYFHKNVRRVNSLEPPHQGDSNEYAQHAIFL